MLTEPATPRIWVLLAVAGPMPAVTKQILNRYVAFVGQTSGREVEAREIAVEMLEQFMATGREFRQWQKLARKSVFESHESQSEKSPQMNGHRAE